LEQRIKHPALRPAQLAKVLRSSPIDRLFRCISGATNVSTFELSQLPMPRPSTLVEELSRTTDVDTAVLRAFGLRQGN
jgi:adenine-specific DNA-methyltransferase